jgi:hypothetical protein
MFQKRADFWHGKKVRVSEEPSSQPRRAGNSRRTAMYRERKPPPDPGLKGHNRTGIDYEDDIDRTKSNRVGEQDWSFDLLTEHTGSKKLQKLFDLYQQPLCPIPPDRANPPLPPSGLRKRGNLQPLRVLDEDRPIVTPLVPHQPPARPSHRLATVQGRRPPNKSTSPQHNARLEAQLRSSSRTGNPKNHKETDTLKDSVSGGDQHPAASAGNPGIQEIHNLHETAGAHRGEHKKAVAPITIIQTPQINNINNYNNININTISINPPVATQPPNLDLSASSNPAVHAPAPPAAPPKVNNFRRRKYKLAQPTDVFQETAPQNEPPPDEAPSVPAPTSAEQPET